MKTVVLRGLVPHSVVGATIHRRLTAFSIQSRADQKATKALKNSTVVQAADTGAPTGNEAVSEGRNPITVTKANGKALIKVHHDAPTSTRYRISMQSRSLYNKFQCRSLVLEEVDQML